VLGGALETAGIDGFLGNIEELMAPESRYRQPKNLGYQLPPQRRRQRSESPDNCDLFSFGRPVTSRGNLQPQLPV
jgi:hypothetical protein